VLLVALLGELAGGRPAEAQSRQPIAQSHDEWREGISKTPVPRRGCFESSYPSAEWHEVVCVTAPVRRDRAPPHAGLTEVVGSGTDFFAVSSSGNIVMAVGSFPVLMGVVSESDTATSCGGTGWPNQYSLQINTGRFITSACNGALDSSICRGWEQFAYRTYGTEWYEGWLWIEFWLLYYDNPCPSGFSPSGRHCVADSVGTLVAGQPVTNLGILSLTGAASSTVDTVILSVGTQRASAVGYDSPLNLAGAWSSAEFNVFGYGGASCANFNSGSTIEVDLQLVDGTTFPPGCPGNPTTTGETNNLTLVGACCPFGGTALPGIKFTESNSSGASAQFCLTTETVPIMAIVLH